jgi:hypothetical protein
MMTADRPTESIVDDYETRSISRGNRGMGGADVAALQEQLTEIFHHVHPSRIN